MWLRWPLIQKYHHTSARETRGMKCQETRRLAAPGGLMRLRGVTVRLCPSGNAPWAAQTTPFTRTVIGWWKQGGFASKETARYIALEPDSSPGPGLIHYGSNSVEVQKVSPISLPLGGTGLLDLDE
jgi:hypothetical protein